MDEQLSPKDVAEAIGVSESSLKRWVDDGLIRGSRTAGGHRRIPRAEAIRFIREHQSPVVKPRVLGFPDVEAVTDDLPAAADEADRLFTYLYEGAERAARGLILALYLRGRSVAELCDGPIRSAMERVGALWQHSAEGIFYEHRATDICLSAINQLRLNIEVGDDAPVGVGGGPSGDPYLLASMMVATVLRDEGWRTVNLGPNTPTESFVQAAREHEARLVWISVSDESAGPVVAEHVVDVADGVAGLDACVVVGGRGLERVDMPHRANMFQGVSMTQAAAFARGMMHGARRDLTGRAT